MRPTSSASTSPPESHTLARRAGIVGAGTLLSRFLGLGRDMTFAALFRREETDAFLVAFTLPNALRQLLGEGAVSSAVVPVLTRTLEREGEASAQRLFAKLRGLSLCTLTAATGLGILCARPLCDLFAHGYHTSPPRFEQVVHLTQIVFPYIFFMGQASLGMAALHAKKRFFVASFAPGLLNVAFLLCAFLLPPLLLAWGLDRAYAMVAGALLGGFLQMAVQWPALQSLGFFGRPRRFWRDPEVREVLLRLAPMTLGLGVYAIDLMLSRRFLSELGPGAQSYFFWAARLCDFPQGIFVLALSTAALPTLSLLAARGDHAALQQTYAQSLSLTLWIAIPASAALVVLGEPLVVALFQRGEFDATAAHETARALAWQGGTLWMVAVVRQVIPVLYALGDTRTPVWISAIDCAVFVGLALGLRGPMHHAGVSVAVAGSNLVQMALLLFCLRRTLGTLRLAEIGPRAARTLLATGIAAAGGAGTAWLLAPLAHGDGLHRLFPGILSGTVFAGLFLFTSQRLASPELAQITAALGARRRRRR